MGDPAHAPTPFHGQGAGQAIEDALAISDLFAEVKSDEDVPFALAAYDQVRQPRGNKNVITSLMTGRIGSLLDPDHPDVKEIADSFAPRMMWLWEKDVKQQSQDALNLFKELKSQAR
jgi:salicylate hydroxylase